MFRRWFDLKFLCFRVGFAAGTAGLGVFESGEGAHPLAGEAGDVAVHVAVPGGVLVERAVAEDESAGFVDGLEGALDLPPSPRLRRRICQTASSS